MLLFAVMSRRFYPSTAFQLARQEELALGGQSRFGIAAGGDEIQLAVVGKNGNQGIDGFVYGNVAVERFAVSGEGLQLEEDLALFFKEMTLSAENGFV